MSNDKALWLAFPDFSPSEFADPHGDKDSGYNMLFTFMKSLQKLRTALGAPIIIHHNGGFASQGHADNSTHYRGVAADFHVIGMELSTVALVIAKLGFTGIGAYPFWNSPGFHVDVASREAIWECNEIGEYRYFNL